MLRNLFKTKLNKYSAIILIFFCIASFRVFMLDKDIPSWDISTFQPMDEYFYGTLAFNLYDHGKINIGDKDVVNQADSIPQTKGTIIHNLVIYVSLLVFGNNYYGLRLPSAICGILSIVLLMIILNRIRKENSEENAVSNAKNKQFLVIALGYITFDFTFLLTSRICEPVIFRMTFILITLYMLYVLDKKNKNKMNYFLFGLLSTLSFLLVYTVNFFAFAAAIMSVGIYFILWRDRKSLTSVLFLVLGIIVGILITALYYRIVWDSSLYDTFKGIFAVYGDRASGAVGIREKLLTYYGHRDMLLNANIFLYSPILLFLLLATLPLSMVKAVKSRRIIDIFIVSLVIMMYLQTIFLDDYTRRKATTILPFVILSIYNGLTYKNVFMEYLGRKSKLLSLLCGVYIIFCGYITFKEPIQTFRGLSLFQSSLDNVLFVLNLVILIFVIAIFFISLFTNLNTKNLINFAFILIVLPSIILSIKYVYMYDNYTEKDIMVDVGKIAGDSYVMGGFPHSYRLYNSIKPVMSDYDAFRGEEKYENLLTKYIEDKKVQYLLGYTYDEAKLKEKYLKNNPNYRFEEIKRYERSFEENHKKTYISLYKIVKD